MENLLNIKNLKVTYTTDDAKVYAVNGLDLSIDRGETLGVVGETGAGKTTMALSIMRLLPNKIGKITEGKSGWTATTSPRRPRRICAFCGATPSR